MAAPFLDQLLLGIKRILSGGTPVSVPNTASPPVPTDLNFTNASVAYNASTGAVDVTVSASAVVSGQNPATLSNGLNSNIATNDQPTVRLSGPSGAFQIGGFQLNGGVTPAAGQTLTVINTTSQPMTIRNEDTSSNSQNRITTQSGLDVTLLPRQSSAILVYDGNASRWVLQNSAPLIGTTQFLGNSLSWSVNPIFNGMAATCSGLSVPCAVGAVMHVGRPPTWPPGVALTAFATAANTVMLEAINSSGATATIPTSSGDVYSIAVHQ